MKIKNASLFKNKTQMIIYIILFILILLAFVYLGDKNFNTTKDNVKFAKEFKKIGEENIFLYASAKDVYTKLDNNVIVLFGCSSNVWTEPLAKIVNEVAIKKNIKEILYYDFYDDRLNNNGNYELIIQKLHGYIYTNDRGKKELYAPTLLIVSEGKIIYFNDDNTFVRGNITPSTYWTEARIDLMKLTLEEVFKNYKGRI